MKVNGNGKVTHIDGREDLAAKLTWMAAEVLAGGITAVAVAAVDSNDIAVNWTEVLPTTAHHSLTAAIADLFFTNMGARLSGAYVSYVGPDDQSSA